MGNVPWNTLDQDKPVMSGIDDTLDCILKSNAAVQRHYDKDSERDYDLLVPAIKQAFIAWVEQDIIGEDIYPYDSTITFPKGIPATEKIMVCDAINGKLQQQRKKLRS